MRPWEKFVTGMHLLSGRSEGGVAMTPCCKGHVHYPGFIEAD